MKKQVLYVVFLFLFSNVLIAQDTLPLKHEFGSVIYNRKYSGLVYNLPDSYFNTFFSGVFYRIHYKKISFKSELNYSRSVTSITNDSLCFDCYSGNSNNRVIEFSSGIQYKFTFRNSYVYGYADILYRHVSSNGKVMGGALLLNDDFKLQANGFGGGLGMGGSLVVFRQFRIGSEFGYDICYSWVDMERISTMNLVTHENPLVINSTMRTRIFLSVSF